MSTFERPERGSARRPGDAAGGSATRRLLPPPSAARAVEYVRSAHRPEDFLRDGRPEIAFVGRSNVGKSSLLNALAGSGRLARTGKTPGRTRAVNYFVVDGRYYLVDLPGYGYARAGREERRRLGQLAERYLMGERGGASAQGAAAARERGGGPRPTVVLLIDGRVGATELDALAHRFLTEVGAAIVVAATKADRVKRGERERQRRSIREGLELPEGTPLVFVSARTGEGLDALWREIGPMPGPGPGA